MTLKHPIYWLDYAPILRLLEATKSPQFIHHSSHRHDALSDFKIPLLCYYPSLLSSSAWALSFCARASRIILLSFLVLLAASPEDDSWAAVCWLHRASLIAFLSEGFMVVQVPASNVRSFSLWHLRTRTLVDPDSGLERWIGSTSDCWKFRANTYGNASMEAWFKNVFRQDNSATISVLRFHCSMVPIFPGVSPPKLI
jgi:hypothetical protein